MASKERPKTYMIEIPEPTCDVCCMEYSIAGAFACGHVVCARCALAQRLLRHRNECLLCARVCDLFIVKYSLADTPAIKLRAMPGIRYMKAYRAFVDTSVRTRISLFQNPPCCDCGVHFQSPRALQRHMQQQHHKQFCRICCANSIAFLSEEHVYSVHELAAHLKSHPRCYLCARRCYDENDITLHYKSAHVRCELCMNFGVADSFWRNQEQLFEHIKHAHIRCEYPECSAGAIGFARRGDYIEHILSRHFEQLDEQRVAELQHEIDATAEVSNAA